MMRRSITHLAFQLTLSAVAFGVQAASPFDPAQWTVKKSVTANFGSTLPNATVLLLMSKRPTGVGAFVGPIYTANVIVTVSGKVIYQFHRALRLQHSGFDPEATFIDDFLELKDVTGDGVPEVPFHTGSTFADGFSRALHIVHYGGADAQGGKFRDIGGAPFYEGNFERVGWLTYAGHPLIIVADSESPQTDDPDQLCTQCPKYHRYEVYEWDGRRQRVVLRTRIPHTKELHGEEDPLQEDRRYILEHLKNLYGPRPPKAHRACQARRR